MTFDLIEDVQFDLKTNRDLLNDFDRVSIEEMKNIWDTAEMIARRGRYGGALLIGKKALSKAARMAGLK